MILPPEIKNNKATWVESTCLLCSFVSPNPTGTVHSRQDRTDIMPYGHRLHHGLLSDVPSQSHHVYGVEWLCHRWSVPNKTRIFFCVHSLFSSLIVAMRNELSNFSVSRSSLFSTLEVRGNRTLRFPTISIDRLMVFHYTKFMVAISVFKKSLLGSSDFNESL